MTMDMSLSDHLRSDSSHVEQVQMTKWMSEYCSSLMSERGPWNSRESCWTEFVKKPVMN